MALPRTDDWIYFRYKAGGAGCACIHPVSHRLPLSLCSVGIGREEGVVVVAAPPGGGGIWWQTSPSILWFGEAGDVSLAETPNSAGHDVLRWTGGRGYETGRTNHVATGPRRSDWVLVFCNCKMAEAGSTLAGGDGRRDTAPSPPCPCLQRPRRLNRSEHGVARETQTACSPAPPPPPYAHARTPLPFLCPSSKSAYVLRVSDNEAMRQCWKRPGTTLSSFVRAGCFFGAGTFPFPSGPRPGGQWRGDEGVRR